MSKELDTLKTLLLKEELQLLDSIKQKVLSQEQFTQEVSQVLSRAIKRAHKEDKGFENALSAPIQEGVSRAFSDNKQSIIDGLLPIMGQLIRKTVANSIKQFVADINRILELGFSTKAFKWRWQAIKTGKSFAEIVFQKTIRYQVNEIFLINQENGLLIEHVGTGNMLKDNNAISAMLSVIQEFIGDSLQSPDDHLQSAEMGENLLFFAHGPKSFLVFVVKGSPTERFKIKAQELVENIHAEFSDVLIDEQNYRNNPDLQNYLQNRLVTKSISDTPKKINWIPWVIGILAIIVALTYLSIKRNNEYQQMATTANSIDGLYVQSVTRKKGKFIIKGLIDPLANITSLQHENIVLDTKPYVSLDEAIIKKRLELIVTDFPGVHVNTDHVKTVHVNTDKQTLNVEGNISADNYSILMTRLNSLIGIEQINNRLVVDNSPAIAAFAQSYFTTNKQLKYVVSHNHVSLTGTLTYKKHQDFIQKITHQFPETTFDNKHVTLSDSNQLLIDKINATVINMPLLEKNNTKQARILEETTDHLQQLLKRKAAFMLTIVGQSDCYGTLSDDHSSKRAKTIMSTLIQNAINPAFMSTKIQACDQFDRTFNDAQKNVYFLIQKSSIQTTEVDEA
ncbi:MAG: hypothetical protein L3J83_04595 [Proteobacteria bacterium]|nr:hypothetical protein [Pseudomonadota bacterium]